MTRTMAGFPFAALISGCAGAATAGTSSGSATSPGNVQDCGTFRQVDPRRAPISAVGLACFSSALAAHRPARLVATALTTEGDPITTTYEARSDGQALVTSGSTQDRFSDRRITVQLCSGVQPSHEALVFTRCTEVASPTAPATSTRP